MPEHRSNRQEQILQVLARMLEDSPDTRITTARLAVEVGVSEAALYRHFPSKIRMYDALLDFAEETLFTVINRMVAEEASGLSKCRGMLLKFLEFCERNPGITRLLTGSALTGEPRRLHDRVAQLYDRLETQLRQVLRQAELNEGQRPVLILNDAANLMLAAAEGRVVQYSRSGFKRKPTAGWNAQWAVLTDQFMRASG